MRRHFVSALALLCLLTGAEGGAPEATSVFATSIFATPTRATEMRAISTEKPKRGTPTPSVDAILEKALQASGGRKAWLQIKSIHMRGTVELPPPSVAPRFESYAKAPNRLLQTITLADGGVIQTGFDGKRGWRNEPGRGVQELQGDELETLKRQGEFHADLHLRDLYPEMRFLGTSQIDGRQVYVIGATDPDGQRHKFYFDATTGLRVGMSTGGKSEGTLSGSPAESTFYSDFREFGGVKVPYTVRLVSAQGTMTLHLDEAVANEAIPDSIFGRPTAAGDGAHLR